MSKKNKKIGISNNKQKTDVLDFEEESRVTVMERDAGPVPDFATPSEISARIDEAKETIKKIRGKGRPMKIVINITHRK